MKIGKYEITKGPNLQWWLVTAFIIWATISTGNWWFAIWWAVVNITLVPMCIWIHKRNMKQ